MSENDFVCYKWKQTNKQQQQQQQQQEEEEEEEAMNLFLYKDLLKRSVSYQGE